MIIKHIPAHILPALDTAQEEAAAEKVAAAGFVGSGREITKLAASYLAKGQEAGRVKWEEEIQKHPDALWFLVVAIVADVVNENWDLFPAEEILAETKLTDGTVIPAYKTFEGAMVFTNHQNDDVANAKGRVVYAEWQDYQDPKTGSRGRVLAVGFIDPSHEKLVSGVRSGIITDVSMGCKVEQSVCSVCGNVATTEDEYCDHIKYYKGKEVLYRGERRLAYEINKGLTFFELSFVVDGAFEQCKVLDVLESPEAVEEAIRELQELATQARSASDIRERAAAVQQLIEKGNTIASGLRAVASVEQLQRLQAALLTIRDVATAVLRGDDAVPIDSFDDLADVIVGLYKVIETALKKTAPQVTAPAAQNNLLSARQQQQQPAVATEAIPVTTPAAPVLAAPATAESKGREIHTAVRTRNTEVAMPTDTEPTQLIANAQAVVTGGNYTVIADDEHCIVRRGDRTVIIAKTKEFGDTAAEAAAAVLGRINKVGGRAMGNNKDNLEALLEAAETNNAAVQPGTTVEGKLQDAAEQQPKEQNGLLEAQLDEAGGGGAEPSTLEDKMDPGAGPDLDGRTLEDVLDQERTVSDEEGAVLEERLDEAEGREEPPQSYTPRKAWEIYSGWPKGLRLRVSATDPEDAKVSHVVGATIEALASAVIDSDSFPRKILAELQDIKPDVLAKELRARAEDVAVQKRFERRAAAEFRGERRPELVRRALLDRLADVVWTFNCDVDDFARAFVPVLLSQKSLERSVEAAAKRRLSKVAGQTPEKKQAPAPNPNLYAAVALALRKQASSAPDPALRQHVVNALAHVALEHKVPPKLIVETIRWPSRAAGVAAIAPHTTAEAVAERKRRLEVLAWRKKLGDVDEEDIDTAQLIIDALADVVVNLDDVDAVDVVDTILDMDPEDLAQAIEDRVEEKLQEEVAENEAAAEAVSEEESVEEESGQEEGVEEEAGEEEGEEDESLVAESDGDERIVIVRLTSEDLAGLKTTADLAAYCREVLADNGIPAGEVKIAGRAAVIQDGLYEIPVRITTLQEKTAQVAGQQPMMQQQQAPAAPAAAPQAQPGAAGMPGMAAPTQVPEMAPAAGGGAPAEEAMPLGDFLESMFGEAGEQQQPAAAEAPEQNAGEQQQDEEGALVPVQIFIQLPSGIKLSGVDNGKRIVRALYRVQAQTREAARKALMQRLSVCPECGSTDVEIDGTAALCNACGTYHELRRTAQAGIIEHRWLTSRADELRKAAARKPQEGE